MMFFTELLQTIRQQTLNIILKKHPAKGEIRFRMTESKEETIRFVIWIMNNQKRLNESLHFNDKHGVFL